MRFLLIFLFLLPIDSIFAIDFPQPPRLEGIPPSSVGISATQSTGSGISISWSGGSARNWEVYVKPNSLPYQLIGTTSSAIRSLSYTPSSDGTFQFAVKACVAHCSDLSVASSILNFRKVPSTPAKPADKNSTSTSYTVSWSKPSGTVTFYSVQEKVGSGSWTTISSSQSGTSISRSGKSNNSVYYYRVRACNTYSWSCSAYSSANTVRVELKPSTPSKPSDINSTSTSYTVSWSKPSGSVNFYLLQERVAGGSWSTIASNHSSTSIGRSGKTNGTNYEYRTRACNSYTWSCSGYSSANSVKVRLKPSTPAAPSRPSTSTGSAAVSWTKPSGNVSYYDLQKRNNNGSWATAKAGDTNTSETVSGLTDGAWDFRVRACNGYSWACSGYSGASADTTVRTKPSTPSAPTVPSSDGNGSYTVSWSKPSGTVSYYDLIERKNNSGSFTTVANNTTATSAALTGRGDGAYDYQVRACNGYDWACSSYSAVSSDVNVLHKPGTPSSINGPTSTDLDGNFTVSWGGSSGAVSYYETARRLKPIDGSYGGWIYTNRGTATSVSHSSLADGEWDFAVRGCNTAGCSSWRYISPRVDVLRKPGTPSSISGPASAGPEDSITISWGASSGDVDYYQTADRHQPEGGSFSSWTYTNRGTARSHNYGVLSAGEWDFAVRACNTSGCSSWQYISPHVVISEMPGFAVKGSPSVGDSVLYSLNVPTSENVGTLKGSADVSGGAATYTIPIEIPPGRNGMQPSLSLDYSSNSSSREAGFGWSLNGISSISRCDRDYAHDNTKASITYTDDDKLCLNGVRLVVTNQYPYGTHGAEYRTELESNAKILQVGSGSNRYFEVTDASGIKHTYGESNNSKYFYKDKVPPLRWTIEKSVDLSGNNIKYYYHSDSVEGEFYLKEVKYTGFNNSDGNRKVVINWQDDATPGHGYFAGGVRQRTKVIQSIETFVDDTQPVKRYDLNYVSAPTSKLNLLKRVTLCGFSSVGQEHCLKPTEFHWNNEHLELSKTEESVPYNVAFGMFWWEREGMPDPFLTDLNFDGIDDRISYDSGFQTLVAVQWGGDPENETTAYSISEEGSNDPKNVMGLAHFKGNGVMSLALLNNDYSCPNTSRNGEVEFAHYNKVNQRFDIVATNVMGLCGTAVKVMDVNADGLDDLLVAIDHDNSSHPHRFKVGVFLNTVGTFSSSPTQTLLVDKVTWNIPISRAQDINGDGYSEIIFSNSATTLSKIFQLTNNYGELSEVTIPTGCGSSTSVLADMNGDGLQDYLCSKRLYWNTGDINQLFIDSGLTLTSSQFPIITGESKAKHKVADLNLDGKDEIYVISSTTPDYFYSGPNMPIPDDCNRIYHPACDFNIKNLHVYSWNRIVYDQVNNQLAVESSDIRSSLLLKIKDYDMDGDVDIYAYHEPDGSVEYPIFGQLKVQHSDLTASFEKLESVENGLGLISRFSYAQLSDTTYPSLYKVTEEPVFPEPLVKNTNVVVREFAISDGIGGELTRTYQYKNGLQNFQGRGYLGFEQITVIENEADKRSETTFEQSFPLTGKVKSVKTYENSSNKLLSIQTFDNGWFGPTDVKFSDEVNTLRFGDGPIDNKTYRTFTKQKVVTQKPLNGSKSFVNRTTETINPNDVDSYGNVTKVTSLVENGFSTVETVKFNHFLTPDLENNWLDKLDYSEVTTRTVSNNSSVYDVALDPQKKVRVEYTWSENRQADLVTTRPLEGGGKTRVVDTDYNAYGLPISVSTYELGNQANSRTVTTSYSENGETESVDGYFPYRVSNGLGHDVITKTNPQNGTSSSVEDVNGLVTQNHYDAFGRLETVEPPAGTGQPVETRYQWCDGSCDGQAFPNDVASRIVFKVTSYQAGAPESVAYKDGLGRTIATATTGFNGTDIVFTTKVFDRQGRVLRESVPSYSPSNQVGTRYRSYDTLGRLTLKEIDQAYDQVMTITYTYTNHSTRIVADGQGKVLDMSRVYSGNGQLLSTTDALNGVTQYAYDAHGNPIVLSDANQVPIKATYNALGQKRYVNDPNMGRKDFTYTGLGEVDTETDANGDEYQYLYDQIGRVYQRKLNGTVEAFFNFDTAAKGSAGTCKGMPASESTANGNFSRSVSYDQYCRPISVTTQIDGENYAMSTQYDGNYGRVKAVTYPSGLTLKTQYNDSGYLTHQINAVSNFVYHEVTEVDARGQVLTALKANGVLTEGKEFDERSGQMTSVYTHATNTGTQRHRIDYIGYDGFGNLETQRVESTVGGKVQTSLESFAYDSLHRLDYSTLSIAGGADQIIDYHYDAVGNLMLKDDYASSFTYGNLSRSNGNAGPNAIRQVTKVGGGTISFTYDNNGNQITGDGRTLTYNAFNKPLTISRNSITSSFFYGSDQMRYKQVKTGKSGGTETTIYVGKDYEVIQYDGKVSKKSYLGDTIITETLENGSTTYAAGFVHRDRLNSVVTITDENGNVVDNKSYDPFGKPRKANLDDASKARLDYVAYEQGFESLESTSLTTRRGFTDHEHLDDAELIHMNGRVYDYNVGRFLSVDPFIQDPGNSQSMNPYSYIMNNPLAGTDPSGYISEFEAYQYNQTTLGSSVGGVWENNNGSSDKETGCEVTNTCPKNDESKAKKETQDAIDKAKKKHCTGAIACSVVVDENGDIIVRGMHGPNGVSAIDRSPETDGGLDNYFIEETGEKLIIPTYENIIVGFDGAGSDNLTDNLTIRRIAVELGAKMYDASAITGAPVDKALRYIREKLKSQGGGKVYLLGYSSGGDEIIELAEELNSLNISVSGLVTFDPHDEKRLWGYHDYKLPANVQTALNFFQRNEVTSTLGIPHGSNPFLGGKLICGSCTNVDFTGSSIVHTNIVFNSWRSHKNEIRQMLGN